MAAVCSSPSLFDFSDALKISKKRNPEKPESEIISHLEDLKTDIDRRVSEKKATREKSLKILHEEAGRCMEAYETIRAGRRFDVFWINDKHTRTRKNPRSRCVVAFWDKDSNTLSFGATVHTREHPNDILTKYQKPLHMLRAAERLRDSPNIVAMDHCPRKKEMHSFLATMGCSSSSAPSSL